MPRIPPASAEVAPRITPAAALLAGLEEVNERVRALYKQIEQTDLPRSELHALRWNAYAAERFYRAYLDATDPPVSSLQSH